MNVSDVIKLACVFVNRQDLLETNLFDESQHAPTVIEQKEIDLLVRCLNLVIGEICCDYIPLVKTEEVNVTGERIDYSDLSLTMLEILQVEDKNGCKCKYKSYPDHITIENGKYDVEYSYIPDSVIFSDDLQCFYGKITERIFAYGVAMEYSLMSSLYDEMEIWQTRFKDALKIAMRKNSEKRLPKRGWF